MKNERSDYMKAESNFEIIPRKKGSGRPSNRPPIERLAHDYKVMSVKECAKKYGVSEATVHTWVFRARRNKY